MTFQYTNLGGNTVHKGGRVDSDGRLAVNSELKVRATGISVATASSAVQSALPVTSTGDLPQRVRLSATQVCYVKLMNPGVVTADAVVAGGSGYAISEVLTVAGGTALTAAQLTVATVDGGGAVLTATVSGAGSYAVEPSNPVSIASTTGSGVGATFNLTFDVSTTLAANTDLMVSPGDSVVLDSTGYSRISYIREAADGKLQVSPLEN